MTKDYEIDWDKGKAKHYTRMLHEMADGFAEQNECDGIYTEEQDAKIERSWELLARFHGALWN